MSPGAGRICLQGLAARAAVGIVKPSFHGQVSLTKAESGSWNSVECVTKRAAALAQGFTTTKCTSCKSAWQNCRNRWETDFVLLKRLLKHFNDGAKAVVCCAHVKYIRDTKHNASKRARKWTVMAGREAARARRYDGAMPAMFGQKEIEDSR